MSGTRLLGVLIILISVLVFAILYDVSIMVATTQYSECSAYMHCTLYQHIPAESWVGFFMLFSLAFLGGFLIYKSTIRDKSEGRKITKSSKDFKNVGNEEKKVLDIVIKYEGSAFQNDIVKESGYSKVKVSRILDRLETKQLVERRRRGMSNIVFLKR